MNHNLITKAFFIILVLDGLLMIIGTLTVGIDTDLLLSVITIATASVFGIALNEKAKKAMQEHDLE